MFDLVSDLWKAGYLYVNLHDGTLHVNEDLEMSIPMAAILNTLMGDDCSILVLHGIAGKWTRIGVFLARGDNPIFPYSMHSQFVAR